MNNALSNVEITAFHRGKRWGRQVVKRSSASSCDRQPPNLNGGPEQRLASCSPEVIPTWGGVLSSCLGDSTPILPFHCSLGPQTPVSQERESCGLREST